MKRLSIVFAGAALSQMAWSARCDLISLVPHVPTEQEKRYFETARRGEELSLVQGRLDLPLLVDLNGWNRFGDFEESAQAAFLSGIEVIDSETYRQLASNGNIRALPLTHADALAMAFMVANAAIPVADVFWKLVAIDYLRLKSAEDVLRTFASVHLELSLQSLQAPPLPRLATSSTTSLVPLLLAKPFTIFISKSCSETMR